MPVSTAHAFGLRWAANTPLPLFPAAPPDGRAPDVVVERVAGLPLRSGGIAINSGWLFDDGIRFTLDGASYEMTDGDRIVWAAPDRVVAPGDGPPVALYSTVTALLLAWRGATPLHGSAVEIDGRAILIGGPSGAGKSTLAAALIARGGRLISDDLSLLAPTGPGETAVLWPGRSSIRLVDRTAADPAAKLLVQPAMTDVTRPVPLTTLLILRSAPIAPGAADRVAALRRQLFRPRWMERMPHRATRLATIMAAAQQLTIATMPPAGAAPGASIDQRAARAQRLMSGAP